MTDDTDIDISEASNAQIIRGLVEAGAIRKLTEANGHYVLLVTQDTFTILKHDRILKNASGIAVRPLIASEENRYATSHVLGNYQFELSLPKLGNFAGHEVVANEALDAIPELEKRPHVECSNVRRMGHTGPSLVEVVAEKVKAKWGRPEPNEDAPSR